MINKILRILLAFPLLIIIIVLLIINLRTNYRPPITVTDTDTINHDLLKELRGLKAAHQNNADERMQKIYPEGYVFFNALYGLAWCNFLKSIKTAPNPYFNEGHAEIQNAWNRINSDTGRAPFSDDLPLAYGAFYCGWSTYLLGKKLSIEQNNNRDSNEVAVFKRRCEQIDSVTRIKTFPVSYYGLAWPADGVICMAALSLHDQLFPAKYTSSIRTWIDRVRSKTDRYGLIPHAVNPTNEKIIETARGSSQSLMLIFLKEIEPGFAMEQFTIYKTNFIDKKLGLTGIREYPKGDYGLGDVDSGPVFLQFGSAATIVGMYTLQLYNEQQGTAQINNTIEAFSFSSQDEESKTYLFGLLPMADAFIVWGHSAMPASLLHTSFITFHLYSLGFLIILALLLWLWFRSGKPSSESSLHIPW